MSTVCLYPSPLPRLRLPATGRRRGADRLVAANRPTNKASHRSIIADPKNPALYTNRALARLKLQLWEDAITDCQTCLALAPGSMKAHYYLSMAQVPLGLLDDALKNAVHAHDLCVELQDRSIANTTAQVLLCKKAQWVEMERRRAREGQQLENELLDMVLREREETLKDETDPSTRAEITEEYDEKVRALRDVFERARTAEQKHRKAPPDWAIDDISFGFMVDPVLVSFLAPGYSTLSGG